MIMVRHLESHNSLDFYFVSVAGMNKYFEKNPYPNKTELKQIANQLKISFKGVKLWFFRQQKMAIERGELSSNQSNLAMKPRKGFTEEQLMILKKAYENSSGHIPEFETFEKVAKSMQLKVDDFQRIKYWFYDEKKRIRRKESLSNSSKSKSFSLICIMHLYMSVTMNALRL